MELTQAEIDRYAPYHTFPEFADGYNGYVHGHRGAEPYSADSVSGQAYDRGAECAMRRSPT